MPFYGMEWQFPGPATTAPPFMARLGSNQCNKCSTASLQVSLPCRARPPGVRHEDFQAELRRRYAGIPGMASRTSISSLHSDLASVADFLQQRPASL